MTALAFFLKIQGRLQLLLYLLTIPCPWEESQRSIAETTEAARDAIAPRAKEIVLSGVNIGDFGALTNETFST